MNKYNPDKPRKNWETSYPRNGPRDYPFRVVFDNPFDDIENDVEKDERYKEHRSEITAWIRNNKIKCDFIRECYTKRVESKPHATTVGSGISLSLYTSWTLVYDRKCYRDVYRFVRESDAVAFKLLFG